RAARDQVLRLELALHGRRGRGRGPAFEVAEAHRLRRPLDRCLVKALVRLDEGADQVRAVASREAAASAEAARLQLADRVVDLLAALDWPAVLGEGAAPERAVRRGGEDHVGIGVGGRIA